MNTEQIRSLAIKRHDFDADYFQSVYSGSLKSSQSQVFLYGRNMIMEELEIVLQSITKGSKILDVGCGTGHLTNWLKEKGYDVFGLEPSQEMYKYAVSNFPGIEFRKGVSSSLPYDDNFFDMVIAIEVLRYLSPEDNEISYKEFKRVLRKGGVCFVTQVNLFSTDGYYFFYKLKGIKENINNNLYQFCNFTTPLQQEKVLNTLAFTNVYTIGRMAGFVRIFYKLGSVIGRKFGKLIKLISKQYYKSQLLKSTAGHLIVIGQK
jgi:ubiquinone/menaquinone biosynthesis C-methylase UbiE